MLNCLVHFCPTWVKPSIFSATSRSSAALSHVLWPLQACHAVAIDFVLDFLQYLPSRACKCQNYVSHCSSGIPNTRCCLGFSCSQTMSSFCRLWYFCCRSLFISMLSHICQNCLCTLSFPSDKVASFYWQVLVGLFLNLLIIFLSLFLHPYTTVSAWPSYQLVFSAIN